MCWLLPIALSGILHYFWCVVVFQGGDRLTCYTYNTHQAKHTFCSVCGVQSFYTPRSNPDGKGVAIHCVDSGTVTGVKVITFDGQNWEKSMEEDDSIKSRSQMWIIYSRNFEWKQWLFVYNYYDKHTLSVEHDLHNNVIQTYNMTNFYKCMVVWYI